MTVSDTTLDYSPNFYRARAQDYARLWGDTFWPVNNGSHPGLKSIDDVGRRIKEMVPTGARGLDAGCGPAVYSLLAYLRDGYDILGLDTIKENLDVAVKAHPELAGRLMMTDLGYPLPFPDSSFSFVMCSTVIQHITPEKVLGVTLPEFARILGPGGILQLIFKSGQGVASVVDVRYDAWRTFQLYDPSEILETLTASGLSLLPQDGDKLGGVMYFTDEKDMRTCILLCRKPVPIETERSS